MTLDAQECVGEENESMRFMTLIKSTESAETEVCQVMQQANTGAGAARG